MLFLLSIGQGQLEVQILKIQSLRNKAGTKWETLENCKQIVNLNYQLYYIHLHIEVLEKKAI